MSVSLTAPDLTEAAPTVEAQALQPTGGRPSRRAGITVVVVAAAMTVAGSFAMVDADVIGGGAVHAQSGILAAWWALAPLLFTSVSLLTACCRIGGLSMIVGLVSKGVTLIIELYVCYSVFGASKDFGDGVLVVVAAISFILVKVVEVNTPVAGIVVDFILGADVAFIIALMEGTRSELPAIVPISMAIRGIALPVVLAVLFFAVGPCKIFGPAAGEEGRPRTRGKELLVYCVFGVPVSIIVVSSAAAWWYLLEADWQTAASTALVVIEATGLVQDAILIFLELVLKVSAVG